MITVRHPSRGFRAGRKCQRNSATPLGPGPQARRTLATFLLWKVARPQAEHPPKTKQRFRRCGGEFLSERSERNQRIAGVSFVRKALRLRLALSLTIPPVPRFTGDPEGCAGSCGRRGDIIKGVYAYSLPFCSVDESGASTRCNAPKWCSIHRGCWSAGGWGHPPLRNPVSFLGGAPLGGIPQRGPRPPFGRFKGKGSLGKGGNSKSPFP